jgi:hypothetical protein
MLMPYRHSAARARPDAHAEAEAAAEYARTCVRHRRRAVASAMVFFAFVVTAVVVTPSFAPPHRPTMPATQGRR